MFEGLVRQLILGYLGCYVKDIQKEQLKITLWNEEVLLENVEIALEAFDYLQLPFALKRGQIGKLSIKIPWKKLGWDPIVILLEDVFVCSSQRDDAEWSSDAVERREFAGKKAKLAAAELGKLSERVCDNRLGQSFISYITAKILDSIQVSIRRFHVSYHDKQGDSVHTMFGLKLASLTIMKQNSIGLSGSRVRGAPVNKVVEIKGFEFYCGVVQGPIDVSAMDNATSEGKKFYSLLETCDISMSLLVNKSREVDDDNPRYFINAELTALEMSLDETQLQQILTLSDYLSISPLREKYGRYRPWHSPLSKKLKGWQVLWWQYAQQSVLSDVRKKLKKTSWRYLGQRLSYRRRYVNLYKTKLHFLRQEQSVDVNILEELEQMEKALDIDYILSYRSSAERELEEFLSDCSTFNINVNSGSVAGEKSRNEERLIGKSKGWLNWLSLGVLGAGGTDDSGQFSGVVSDEIIKDIFEATKFHPEDLSYADDVGNNTAYFCAVKFSIHQISLMLHRRNHDQEIAEFIISGTTMECKLWEECATFLTVVNSVEAIYPCNRKAIFLLKRACNGITLPIDDASCSIQVDFSPKDNVKLSIKVMLQSLEVICDVEFFINFMEIFMVLKSFESHHERVLASLNGIKDVSSRLLSKAEYILSNRKNVTWDFSITSILINIPWVNGISEQNNLVIEVGSLIMTKCDTGSVLLDEERHDAFKNLSNSLLNTGVSFGFQPQDLYDHFEVKIYDFEIKVEISSPSETVSILEKFSGSFLLARCVIPDQSILKQLEVQISLPTIYAHFSLPIYEAVMGLMIYLAKFQPKLESLYNVNEGSFNVCNGRRNATYGFSLNVRLEEFSLFVKSRNDEDNCLAIIVNLQEVVSCLHLAESEECLLFMKGLDISASPLRGEGDALVLYSSGTPTTSSTCQYGVDTGQPELIDSVSDQDISSEACFIMHYVSPNTGLNFHECTICLNDGDLHCYPDVIGSLIVFFDNLSTHSAPNVAHNSCGSLDVEKLKEELGFQFQMFGFSNFLETESSQHACIPFDRFPFVTLHNSGSLGCLESSLLYSGNQWRKKFIMRDGRIRSPQIRAYDVQNAFCLSCPESTSTSDTDGYLLSGRSDSGNLSVINLNVSGIRVHFHDSSCSIGTIEIPSLCGSLSIHEDFTDIMCSTEGLTLNSTLWKNDFFDFLWGPSLPNLSPVLNVRVQRKRCRSSSYPCEVGLSVQNVNCILPPEYLALIIGYFSQSNWSGYLNGQTISKEDGNSGVENESSVIYKFEILDSFLIVPVESIKNQFLKAEIMQLYCSFILNSSLDDVLKGIHFECLIPTQNFAKRNNCLNIFGRELVLSFLTFKEDGHTCLRLGHEAVCESITLLDPLSADIWVRIPRQSKSSSPSTPIMTCIMIRVVECQVSDEDGCSFYGFLALLDVINQFLLVSEKSNSYRSDALYFLKSSTCLEKKCASSSVNPIVAYSEVRCVVDSFFICLSSMRKGTSRLIARAELKFLCSASLTNDCLSRLVISFSSLSLFSLPNYVLLARCTPTLSILSVLEISLSCGNQGENTVHVSFPSLDVWLHLSCWTEIIDLFTYAGQRSRNAPLVKEHAENMEESSLVVLLENIGITLHFPVWVSNEACKGIGTAEYHSEASLNASYDMAGRDEFKSIAVTLHSRSTELLLDERMVNLKSNMDKLTGSLSLCEDKNDQSWPLFQIFHVFLESEISKDIEAVEVKLELQCDNFDVWLSHHFFYFWHGVPFITSDAESSQFPFRSIDFNIQLRKVSFLLTDGQWSSGGPLFEILLRDVLLHVNIAECTWDVSVSSHIQVNYNNIHKVFWEPFVEPWQFEVNVTRKREMSLSSSIMTDVNVKSTAQLNLNLTESVVECVSRTVDMIMDSLGMIEPNDITKSQKLLSSPLTGCAHAGKHAPYVLQNLTSLPLLYHVNRGPINELDASEMNSWKYVQPGSLVPIYIVDTPEEQLFHARLAGFSDNIIDRKTGGVAHHFITIQLDGTSTTSGPISMDLVGISCFEVDFSNAHSKSSENVRRNISSGFLVPVVFDVSVQRHNKLIQIYSTVILSNATSMPLELRFDIPFGVSPKILDPIYPGQELPLPLHLAEAGRMRWRPIGNSYLWSEVYNLSNLLSQEARVGFLKSFVCYPAHPSSDQFRCCISVRSFSLPESGWANKPPLQTGATSKTQVEKSVKVLHKLDEPHKRFVHQLILSTPLIVDNYLPKPVSVTIECGGVTRTEFLSEVATSFHHVDPSHDLGLEFQMHGFKPSALKFPGAEAFCSMAKFSGTKFSLSEILTFDPEQLDGSLTYVTLEKTLDAFSGARELFIHVPFLLYNCTSFPLVISECTNEMKGLSCIIPSSYDVAGQELFNENKDGLYLVSSSYSPLAVDPYKKKSTSPNNIISTRGTLNLCKEIFYCNYIASPNSKTNVFEPSSKGNLSSPNASSDSSQHKTSSLIGELTSSKFSCIGDEHEKVVACMYSPMTTSTASEVKVRVHMHLPEAEKHVLNSVWSSAFLLVPPSGSTTVLVPLSATNTAFLISVTSSTVAGPLTGRTSAISFQPRFVISNACSKDLCYRQKGTDFIFRLNRGQHSYLHWMDITRELLVSIRYNEPGWQWSGSFSPDCLGDTQVKMRNHVSNTLNIIRVEVQNADVLVGNEKNGGNLHGNSGTNLILLSDDDTGYMPYRVDNFTKERLRIFQQRCETFETTVHSYSSCPYAWDEPCYPHRLTVEVPGERVLGSFSLDEVKDYMSLYLPSSSEKPERTLLVSVYAEGATKVLCIIDSRYHVLNDVENASGLICREKRKHDQKQDKVFGYKEKLLVVLPYISISLIDFQPQELLFACAKNIKLDLLQSLDQQKLSFQVTSLQIDNQLRSSQYPVMLSFDHEYKGNPTDHKDDCRKTSERVLQRTLDISYEPAFCLAVSKWRKKDISLVSFEYISLRVADFHLELEQELIFSLFDFIKNVSSRFESRGLPLSDPLVRSLIYDSGMLESSSDVGAFDPMKKRWDRLQFLNVPVFNRDYHNLSLPTFVPIGAPWQKIYLLARRHRKVYVEVFDIGPIKMTLSFSSAPWVLRNGILTSGESLIHRGLMALADVEGAQIHLKQLTITHHIASWESIEEIVIRHYTRQLLHEMYKVFGSAGVIGNPMGFARSLGHGIRDFLSVPARSIFQSPTGLITGMAQGTTSLLSNTVYAISDATTQFSKAAHKGIVAFTFDDQVVSRVEQQQIGIMSHTKGVINEVFEGLTGLLQSPIKGAEKHGLPGVLSGIALGITGLVAKPTASILQVTGKTAQSIRHRSRLHQKRVQFFRLRLPRLLNREHPLQPYSWEEAVATSVLVEVDDGLMLKDEVLVACKALKKAGKFVIITERLVLIVSCSSLVDLGKPEFQGIPSDMEWVVESEIRLDSVIHADADEGVVHIVGSSTDTIVRKNHQNRRGGEVRPVRWSNPTLPLIQTNLELKHRQDAEDLLKILLSAIEQGKEQGWGCKYILHRTSIK